jgi:hypothetical protein
VVSGVMVYTGTGVLYCERLRGMALVQDWRRRLETQVGGRSAGNAAIRHGWRRLEADGKQAHSAQPCRARINTAATLLLQ